MKHKTTRAHYEKYKDMAKKYGISLKEWAEKRYKGELLQELYDKDPLLNHPKLMQELDMMYYSGRALQGSRNWPDCVAYGTCIYKHLIIYEVLGLEPEFTDEEVANVNKGV